MEELDKANSKLPASAKAKAAKAKGEAPSSGSVASKAKSAADPILEQSKEWWNRATSLAPAETESSVVRCRLPGQTQFMDRDDCLARGGVASGLSG